MAGDQASTFPSRVHRGPDSSYFGTSFFTILRALDPVLQYGIITRHWGISYLPGLIGGALISTTSSTTFFHLPPYQRLILFMSIGTTIKQVFWAIFITQQELPITHAIAISVFNSVFNSLNTALSSWSLTCAFNSPHVSVSVLNAPSILIGTLLYTVGILTETISEIQRYRFKKNPQNAGKPYSDGLFGWARNINYGMLGFAQNNLIILGGYALWRSGFAWTAAGPIWGLLIGAFFFRDFAVRGVPELNDYCQKRVNISCC